MDATDTASKNALEKELLASLLDANKVVNGIDSLSDAVKGTMDMVNEKDLPGDSVTLYKQELNDFSENFRTLRSEYITGRSQIRSFLTELGSTSPDVLLTSVRKNLEDQYTDLFQIQLDSIEDIQNSYIQIEPGLLGEIRKGPRKARNNKVLDGFRSSHVQLKNRLDSIYDLHKSDYNSYRDGAEKTGTGPIMSLENLHLRVDDIYGETGPGMTTMDMEISRLEAAVSELNPRPTARNLIIIGSILLFIILVIVIRRISLRVKRVSAAGIAGMPTLAASENAGIDVFGDHLDEPAEYYKVMIPSDPQDIMLSEVHFHIRVIKSIYHLVQGAMLDKQPENFGGLMFGRQYKSNGTSAGRHTLIVEKIIAAHSIRPGMAADKEKGAQLVDEIEKIVLENKKMALLGWFTSSAAKDLEMPDQMVKVHRTYFRDKWQLACLVHPGTDKLDSGIFVRRKSGFFDKVPPPEYRLAWDELYQFAVTPPLKRELEEKTRPNPDEYLKIDLNQNWCDSIVEKAYIHPSVVSDIISEKESKEQIAAGQIANGFFYGQVWSVFNEEDVQVGYEIFIEKLAITSTSENPRELPGSVLLGWLMFDRAEIFESLKKAIPYHNEVFTSSHQMAVLINSQTDELRIFSRKHSLEMNNNTIETEEFNLSSLAGDANSLNGQS